MSLWLELGEGRPGREFCLLLRLAWIAVVGLLVSVAAFFALSACRVDAAPQPVVTASMWQGSDGAEVGYIVQPGDTLASIAAQTGTSAEVLMRANGLQNPRLIYPGQRLTLLEGWENAGASYVMSAGERVITLSLGSGVPLAVVARANRLLLPSRVPLGWPLWLPKEVLFRVVPLPAGEAQAAPRVATAVRSGARWWDVLRLNALPHYDGQEMLVPDVEAEGSMAEEITEALPFPLTGFSISSQPVIRGDTVAIAITASEPITCRLHYFGQEEACVTASAEGRRYALAGLSPMMAPGAYTMTLAVTRMDGTLVELPVPVQVAAGRYDYERIDLPPDRQSLLDPTLSQFEREKIAQMQGVRSALRLWEYPFQRPIDAAVTSYFGSRRSYGYGFGSFHAGSDFDGVGGEPVVAPATGVILLAEPLVVRGNAILIDHGWGVVSGFWHLAEIGVEVGQQVSQGEQIGLLGNTGLSTGAHLHWELWVNGAAVNALTWLEPEGPGALLSGTP